MIGCDNGSVVVALGKQGEDDEPCAAVEMGVEYGALNFPAGHSEAAKVTVKLWTYRTGGVTASSSRVA